MFDKATIQYRADMPDAFSYDVKLYSRRNDGAMFYAGNGRFCPTIEAAQTFARDNAHSVEIITPEDN